MRRMMVGALAAATLMLIGSVPAQAQVRVRVGVEVPIMGGRVVGEVVPIMADPLPVVVVREARRVDRRGGPPPWAPAWGHRRKAQRETYVYVQYPEVRYQRDVREAQRRYEREVREARREYERDLRRAERYRRVR